MQQYEGKRVRGPNGERGVIRNGQIVIEAPQAGVPELVVPPQLKPGQDVDLARDQVGLARDRAALETAPIERERAAIGLETDRLKLEQERKKLQPPNTGQRLAEGQAVLDSISSARDNIGTFTTGLPAQIIGGIGGTPAYDLRATLDTIKANLGFDKLQAMREASPTGGALGQVTERELALLQSTLANLDTAQSPEQLRANLDKIETHYRNFLGALDGKMPGEGGDPAASVGGAPAVSAAGGPGGGQPPLDPTAFNAEIERRIKAGEGVEQINAFAMAQGYEVDQEALAEGVRQRRGRVVSGDSNVVEGALMGAADTLTFGFLDELGAVVDTIGLTPGRPNILDGGAGLGDIYNQNLRANRERMDRRQDVNPLAYGGGQVAGAVAVPFGAGARGVQALTKVGGAQGAAYGFGSSDGNIVDRAGGAALGGAAGAAGGAAFGAVAPKVSNALAALRKPGQQTDANALIQAADRQGVEVLPADVGGPVTRRATAAGAQFPLSAGPITRGGQRTIDQSAAARDRAAASVGKVADAEGAGEAVRSGADKFRAATSQRAERLYDRAETMARGTRVTPTRAIEALDRNIAELSEIPGGSPELPVLQRLRDEMAKGNFSIDGVRGMRTALRKQFLANGLRASDVERRVSGIVEAASEDIVQNLSEAGLEDAAGAYKAADGFWRTRVETIDRVLKPIIGKDGSKSGEQILASIESASKSNGRQLQQLMAALPEEEASTVRATVISRMGAANPGAQNAEGSAFSLQTFLTQWNKMTPRAKATLFKGETRAALDDLAKIASGARASAAYANRSNTGSVVGITATGTAGLGGIPTLVATALAQVGAGKLLASPAFARWLARAPRNPAQQKAHIDRLAAVATKTPAIRNEVIQLQQRLTESFSRPLAAEEEPAPVEPK